MNFFIDRVNAVTESTKENEALASRERFLHYCFLKSSFGWFYGLPVQWHPRVYLISTISQETFCHNSTRILFTK